MDNVFLIDDELENTNQDYINENNIIYRQSDLVDCEDNKSGIYDIHKLIYKENLYSPLNLGEIDTSNICFCSSIKNNSIWNDKQYGDYNYFKPLFDNCDINDKGYIDLALTSTQFSDKIGNFGENN